MLPDFDTQRKLDTLQLRDQLRRVRASLRNLSGGFLLNFLGGLSLALCQLIELSALASQRDQLRGE